MYLQDPKNVTSATLNTPVNYGFQSNIGSPSQNLRYGGAPSNVWTTQPPNTIPNCPPGLEHLLYLDGLFVRQQVELLEVLIGFETQNRYEIFNKNKELLFYAKEDSHCCSRNCCGEIRPFEMSITNNAGTEVIRLQRPLACDSCWFPCCLQNLKVFTPPGVLVGSVNQDWSICKPHFSIKNATEDTLLYLDGPICTTSICRRPVTFTVLALDGKTEVGRISKEWAGFVKEIFTDADYFGISFPVDLDVRIKAVMLGACFIIEYMFFEGEDADAPGMI